MSRTRAQRRRSAQARQTAEDFAADAGNVAVRLPVGWKMTTWRTDDGMYYMQVEDEHGFSCLPPDRPGAPTIPGGHWSWPSSEAAKR